MQDAELYASRRKAFLDAMEPGSVAVIPTAPESRRANDTEFPYRPDTDFFYLTGFPEPDAVAVLAKDHGDATFVLFVRERDPERETWTGRRAGPDGAKSVYQADDAFVLADVETRLPGILANASALYFCTGRYESWDRRLIRLTDGLRSRQKFREYPPRTWVDPTSLLQTQRLVKSDDEIALIREAVQISAEAHREAMAFTRPGHFEYEVQAVVEYVFKRRNCTPGYTSIVGGGDNATVLHYVTNDHRLNDGELLLIDAGAEVPTLFTGDITRTFPINGTFSATHRQVYEIVLDSQKQAIAAAKPGATLDDDIHGTAVRILTQGMLDLGLLEGDLDGLVEDESYKKYYMHRTSHWLGMDVHDTGDYYLPNGEGFAARALEPGMIITVEPGLYIPADDESAPEELRGIGIRIEDDVLITAAGHDVLSKDAPKEIADIEKEMKRESIFS